MEEFICTHSRQCQGLGVHEVVNTCSAKYSGRLQKQENNGIYKSDGLEQAECIPLHIHLLLADEANVGAHPPHNKVKPRAYVYV